MSLTSAQIVDVRRFLGYQSLNAGFTDTVYSIYDVWNRSTVSLTVKLASMTADELAVLTTVYLANLTLLEQAILDAQGNLDTLEAGPWIANPDEIRARTALFDQWRRNLAAFLGFRPGPSIGGGPTFFTRA